MIYFNHGTIKEICRLSRRLDNYNVYRREFWIWIWHDTDPRITRALVGDNVTARNTGQNSDGGWGSTVGSNDGRKIILEFIIERLSNKLLDSG